MNKKVCIYVPSDDKGFFGREVVEDLEKRLQKDDSINFIKNVDLAKTVVIGGKIYCEEIDITQCDLFFLVCKKDKSV